MNEEKYLKDISEIKYLMNKSSRFLSLSGLSGILAGTYALIGAYLARQILQMGDVDYIRTQLFVLGLIILILSVATALVMSYIQSRKRGEKMWDAGARNLLWAFSVPLFTGGALVFILLIKGYVVLVAPVMLIFYGLALINAAKYTYGSIYYLGLLEVALGLVAALMPGYGLTFWAIGFGLLHIIYGALMYFKFERN